MKQTLLCLLLFTGTLQAQVFTTPPTTAVRTMAEWEELQTLLISWDAFSSILVKIVKAAQPQCKVVIFCKDQSTLTAAKDALIAANIVLDSHIELVIRKNDTVWMRDYGPNAVYANNVDSLLLVDWIYNRDRPLDNTLPVFYGQQAGIPVYATTVAPYDLVNTGGNFMTDGLGTAFASKLVFRNNDQIANGENGGNDVFGTTNHTESSIDEVMAEFMGIDRYIKLDELPYDGIHHIDMHIKLLDEETLLVGTYPEGVSDGPQIESNLLYIIDNFKTSFGTNFKVVRVPMPSYNNAYPPFPYPNTNRYPTYANAVFVNKTVIMPKYNHELDQAAQDTFQKYLPGYEIVQIDCNSMIGAGGAIHCITKEIGVNRPLHLAHPSIRFADAADPESFRIRALAEHISGIAGVKIFWTTNLNSSWNEVELVPEAGVAHNWTGLIPAQPEGVTVHYYLSATASDSKTITRPMTAPEGYYTFNVLVTSGVNPAQIGEMRPVFPNPARAITTIPVHFSNKASGSIYVLDALGRRVSTIYEGTFQPGDSRFYLDASRYASGTYQVVLETAAQQIAQSLVVE